MSDLDDLERRKRELELRRDIAKLERNERIAQKASYIAAEAKEISNTFSIKFSARGMKTGKWSWLLVGPLTLFGLSLVIGGLNDGKIFASMIGVVCLIPVCAKLMPKS